MSWFQNLFDARRKIAAWRKEYNVERPHSSLGYQTPHEFAAAMRAAEAGSALMAPPSSAASPELKMSYDPVRGEWGQVTTMVATPRKNDTAYKSTPINASSGTKPW